MTLILETKKPKQPKDYPALILEKEQLQISITTQITEHMEKHMLDIVSKLKDFIVVNGEYVSTWQDVLSKLVKIVKKYITEYPRFKRDVIITEAQSKYLLFNNSTVFKKDLPYRVQEKIVHHFNSLFTDYCTYVHTTDLRRFYQLDRELYMIE